MTTEMVCVDCGAGQMDPHRADCPDGGRFMPRYQAEQAPPPMPEPKAAELLGRAARHMHDRATTYDQPDGERSMGKTVEAFNAITGRNLRESEGWLFMSLLKLVRSETRSEPHQDSLEDNIAYSALYAEARGEGR